jgi:molecular chaperone HscB
MPLESSGPSVQTCRTCAARATSGAHFCPQCSRLLPLSAHADFFSFLGVPRRLNLDSARLDQSFRELSRQFHPDFFYNAPPAERRASLERSSYLNDAYRTLKHPISRIEYLVSLYGLGPAPGRHAEGIAAAVPPALLEEVFALNEELDGIRELRESGVGGAVLARRLADARAPIEARRRAHEADLETLSTRWDAAVDAGRDSDARSVLEKLRDRLLERHYINNLLSTIDREAAAGAAAQS